jgi:hypothetical protein
MPRGALGPTRDVRGVVFHTHPPIVARLIYRMLRFGTEYVDRGQDYYEPGCPFRLIDRAVRMTGSGRSSSALSLRSEGHPAWTNVFRGGHAWHGACATLRSPCPCAGRGHDAWHARTGRCGIRGRSVRVPVGSRCPPAIASSAGDTGGWPSACSSSGGLTGRGYTPRVSHLPKPCSAYLDPELVRRVMALMVE